MKYSLIIFLIGTSLLAAGCNIDRTKAGQSDQLSVQTGTTVQNTQPTVKSYTMAEVNQANSQSKCWTVIGGSVYDLTTYMSIHPGGVSKILSLCGTDGTKAFNNQHGMQSLPINTLEKLKIGVLAS
jgi:cytochrome b involved in lipid metabolism